MITMNYNMLISTNNSLIMNMVMEMAALVAEEAMSQVRYKICQTNMTNMLMK